MSAASEYAELLKLIEVSGPFISLPVFREVFPQGLIKDAPDLTRELRELYTEWRTARALAPHTVTPAQREWMRAVLLTLLEWPADLLVEDNAIPQNLSYFVAQHHETLRPDYALLDDGKPRLLITLLPPAQQPDRRPPSTTWNATCAARMAELLHATRVPLGLVTNGERFTLVYAEPGQPTGFADFHAELWFDERLTFALADIIINSSDRSSTTDSINRFVELLFGNSFHTPTRDEQGMYLAQGAAYRSASLARQVGAALCKVDGSLVAVGSNEVPTSGGGQYWPDDKLDGRDFRSGYDSSDHMRENLLAEILGRLQNGGWLAADKATMPVGQLVQEALRTGKPPLMKGAQFTSTIDFVRAVHAEMAALTDAARRGVATDGTILYTTTFPCHDCAKHVVASGVKRVVYIEPYTKSLVNELYSDSILVDSAIDCGDKVRFDPFVGIAPKRYSEFFALSKRRRTDASGAVLQWRPNEANPQLPDYMPSSVATLTGEEEAFKLFMDGMRSASLTA